LQPETLRTKNWSVPAGFDDIASRRPRARSPAAARLGEACANQPCVAAEALRIDVEGIVAAIAHRAR
jgi:hypothetical protein